MKREADEFCTSMVAFPPGSPEKFCLVMRTEQDVLYFFVSRAEGHAIAESIIDMVGYDA